MGEGYGVPDRGIWFSCIFIFFGSCIFVFLYNKAGFFAEVPSITAKFFKFL